MFLLYLILVPQCMPGRYFCQRDGGTLMSRELVCVSACWILLGAEM